MYRDNYLKKQLKDKYGDEQVFVVPFSLVKTSRTASRKRLRAQRA